MRRRNPGGFLGKMRCSTIALLLLCFGCDTEPLRLGPVRIPASTTDHPEPHDAAIESGVPEASLDGSFDASDVGVCLVNADAAARLQLPFVVDRYFSLTGGIGDAAFFGAVRGEPLCDRVRPADAKGRCYHFEYTPRTPQVPGTASYAALFFQYPARNFGSEPGLRIEPGAKRVVFYAAGRQGGEIVTFRSGGIHDASLPCADEFSRELTVRLTPDFERYEIDLNDAAYDFVISPLSWKISQVLFSDDQDDIEPIGFYLDDVRWE